MTRAWRFALGRNPSADESRLSLEHLADQQARFGDEHGAQRALESLCHVLLNGNEFIYVD